LKRALLPVHMADDNAHREPEVVLFLFGFTRKRGAGLQVIGLQPHRETLIDFAVEPPAGHQRPARADFGYQGTSSHRSRHAARALMPVQEFAKRRPAFVLAAGKLKAKKKVVLARRHIERGRRRRLVELTAWKRRR